MVCGWCQKPGHNISKCSEEGTKEERERRKSDPKEVEKREKAAQKKEVENQEERRSLGITEVMKPLRRVNIEPGKLKKEYEVACETVGGAIGTVLTSEYMQIILKLSMRTGKKLQFSKFYLMLIQG